MNSQQSELRPYFSVIIPVYNKEEHVARAIRSVLEQTYDNYELLVVCDPSTDKSNEQVRQFYDSRLRVFYRDQPGPGGYAARNLGIQKARGQYISFLDADDEWWKEHLAHHRRLIAESGCALVATAWLDCWEGEVPRFSMSSDIGYNGTLYPLVDFLREYASKKNIVHTNTISISKELFDNSGGFPEDECKRGGDVATWLKLACAADSVCLSPRETAIYHREASTVTKDQCPEVENNCVRLHVEKLLSTKALGAEERRLLKKLSNRHLMYGLVSRASSGTLRLTDSGYLYREVDAGLFWFFRLFGLLPGPFQRLMWSAYRKARR